jgi:transposase
MPKTIISEETYIKAQNELKRIKVEGTLFKKLQAVKLAYEHGIKETAKFLNIFPVSIRNWARLINRDEIDSLKIGSKHRDGIKLKKHHRAKIKEWLAKDPNTSIADVRTRIKNQFNLEVSESTIRRAMKDGGFSYITPRKNHYKQDKEMVENFKKKSTK